MTNQEAFDAAATHLLVQDDRATNGFGECAYRGDRGLKCAIGALIPDCEYSDAFEGLAASSVKHDVPTLRAVNMELLDEIQKVHDECPIAEWPDRLRDLARTWSLSPAVLVEGTDDA